MYDSCSKDAQTLHGTSLNNAQLNTAVYINTDLKLNKHMYHFITGQHLLTM